MKTILFAGDSYAVADPEHKHHGEIIAEHFGLNMKEMVLFFKKMSFAQNLQ